MLKKNLWCALLAVAVVSLAGAGTGLDIEEGQWEITVDFEIPGMPMNMPPNVYVQCLKKDDPVPMNEKPNQACTSKDVQIKGNTVTWTVICTNPGGEMTGNGNITYQKNKMNGTMTMQGQGMTMVSQFKGRRIGNCK